MLRRRSLFERWLTLPVGIWLVAPKQSIRSVGSHVRNLTALYFERKETKFVGNKTAIYGCNRSSFCLLFVKLARLCVFSSLIRRSHTQEQAGSMPSTQAVAPSSSHNRDDSEKVRTFNKRTHRHKPFDRQRFVSVLWLRHAQLRHLDLNQPIFFCSNFCRFRSEFAWALPLSLSSPWTIPWILS